MNYGKFMLGVMFYFNVMLFFKNKFNKVLFIVGFMDIEWCRKIFDGELNIYIFIGNLVVEDIVLFSLVNYMIMLVGMYGWWVGWMFGGISIYYKYIYVFGSLFFKNFWNNFIDDFIYLGWILMD